MSFRDVYEKEKRVVLYGQTRRFRIIKYIVIFLIATIVYAWKGIDTVLWLLLISVVASLCIHFLFRWKTAGWTKSWGPGSIDCPWRAR